ncbi:MAG: hypothetical protein GX852_02210 [Clostridiales bacterium]|jgi:V/A-type H+-transporting ATPase subunit E|nr:hypothetical protein [Clostridiales bacterium]
MSIESITKRIQDEAIAYSESVKADAEAAKTKLLAEAQDEATKVKESRSAVAAKDAETLKSRRQSVAGLEARKMKLEAKQELIEEVFSKVIDNLHDLDPDEYVHIICDKIAPHKNLGGTVLLNKEDYDRYADKFREAFKGTKLVLGDEFADIRGGCVLVKDNVTYNASIEEVMRNNRVEYVKEIAKVLF